MTMENSLNKQDRIIRYPSEQKDGLDLSMPALDLSRKRNTTRTLPEIKEIINLSVDLSRTAPVASANERYQQMSLPDGQSPIACSSALLSPYSESNSPKRPKIDSVSRYENSSQLKHDAILSNNMRDIIPGITMITPRQPSLHALPNEATKISAAMQTMPIPCTETSQTFMTHEAERPMPLTMPSECTTDVRLAIANGIPSNTLKKVPRPFKAYPKNFMSILPPFDHNSNENYAKFRKVMLENVKKMHGNAANPKMRRGSKSPGLPTSTVDEKDATYWERRRKNNEAAKRSREARRAKEDEIAIRAAYLEHENAELKLRLKNLQLMYNQLCTMLN